MSKKKTGKPSTPIITADIPPPVPPATVIGSPLPPDSNLRWKRLPGGGWEPVPAGPPPPRRMRTFEVSWTVLASVTIEDGAIQVGLDKEWQRSYYKLFSDEEVVAHIAYNLVANRAELPNLDGWADRAIDDASLADEKWVDVEVKEVHPEPEKKKKRRKTK